MALGFYDHRFTPGRAGVPVLILLHGTGGDKESFAGFGRELAPDARLLALDGDVREGPMRRFFRRRAEGVYDMDDLSARTARLAAFLGAAADEYGFSRETAIGVGYSNGANILASLVFAGPWRPARVVLMHPLIPFVPPPADLSGIDALVTAGRRDPIAPWPLTESLAAALADRGATVRVAAHDSGHEATAAEVSAIGAFLAGSPDS